MDRKDAHRRRKRKEKLARAKRHGLIKSKAAATASRGGGGPTRAIRENRRFNRRESDVNHYYYEEYGHRGVGSREYDGWIKCRLLHGRGFSLIIPDQSISRTTGFGGFSHWRSGQTFLGNCQRPRSSVTSELTSRAATGLKFDSSIATMWWIWPMDRRSSDVASRDHAICTRSQLVKPSGTGAARRISDFITTPHQQRCR